MVTFKAHKGFDQENIDKGPKRRYVKRLEENDLIVGSQDVSLVEEGTKGLCY